ncbi:hypothetical protein H2248_009966 [Termitomyces sp. 'cryptogamus']|nr:hypothetical protein H2248_009966 [Termitomyces sp. 'cryptogamus']
MTNNTLNVDSRFNIFHLSADMHRMFDRGRWLLIPEQRVVDIFKEKLTKPIQEYVTEPTYRYRLIASKEMIHFPIFRLNDLVPADPPQMLDLEAGIVETFVYPFHNFPLGARKESLMVYRSIAKLLSVLMNLLVEAPLR